MPLEEDAEVDRSGSASPGTGRRARGRPDATPIGSLSGKYRTVERSAPRRTSAAAARRRGRLVQARKWATLSCSVAEPGDVAIGEDGVEHHQPLDGPSQLASACGDGCPARRWRRTAACSGRGTGAP